MTCFGCSCVGTVERNVQECLSAAEHHLESGVCAVKNAPGYWKQQAAEGYEYWSRKARNAPAYWSAEAHRAYEYWIDQLKKSPAYWGGQITKAPSFWWGQIAAAPAYWTEQAAALARSCMTAVNAAVGIDQAELERTVTDLQREIEELQGVVRHLSQQKERISNIAQEHFEAAQEFYGRLSIAGEETARLQHQAAHLQKGTDDLHAQLAVKEAALGRLKEENQGLEQKIAVLVQERDASLAHSSDLSRQLSAAKAEINSLNAKIKELTQKKGHHHHSRSSSRGAKEKDPSTAAPAQQLPSQS